MHALDPRSGDPRQGRCLGTGTPQERKWWAQLGILSTMGIAMAISLATGVLGGYYLDRWLGTRIFFWVGLLVGILAAYRTLWVFYTRYMRERSTGGQQGSPGGSGGCPP